MKHFLGAIAIAAAAGVGCGGGGDLALEDFAVELGAVTCEKIFSCCTDPEIMAQFEGINPPIDSVEDCKNFYSGLATAFLVPSIRDGEEGGRLVYHADRAGACLDTVADMSCEEFAASGGLESFGACENPIEPLVELGGTCYSDSECLSGHCEQGQGNEGTCAELPGEGEPCEFECAEGYYCGFDQETFEPVCIAQLADGSECERDDACASGSCEGDDPQSGTPGTCGSAMTCDGV